ncbi:MAG: hypothetical protein PF694_05495 [Bacteroidetes bacterium]|jgi:hypothetical protein|nr:hypothetical protein [Bacteroidota bacterium]
MNIQAQKLDLIEWIISTEDKDLIRYLCKIRSVQSYAPDWSQLLRADELEVVHQKLMQLEKDSQKRQNIADKLYEGYL